jgi:hypothetical protein
MRYSMKFRIPVVSIHVCSTKLDRLCAMFHAIPLFQYADDISTLEP